MVARGTLECNTFKTHSSSNVHSPLALPGAARCAFAAGDLTARDDATHQGPCIYLYSVSNWARDTPRRSRV